MDKTENEDTYTTSVGRPIEAIVPSLDKPKLIDYSNQILPAKHYNHGDAIVYSSSSPSRKACRSCVGAFTRRQVSFFGVKSQKDPKSEPFLIA